MKKINPIYFPLLLGLCLALGIFAGAYLNFETPLDSPNTTNKKKEKLGRLIDYIDYEYVDAVNTDSIVDVTVNSILANLDPHSTYIPQSEYAEVSENMKGDFVGIGINFYRINDTITVIRPLDDSPSAKAGIKAGDRILYADNQALFSAQLSNDSLSKILKGKVNSSVLLKVQRKGSDSLLEIEVERDHIPIKSIDAAYMLGPQLGYIKINRFAENTFIEYQEASQKLIDLGAKNMVLDLRDNGGGFLKPAIQIADDFLKEDQLILFTKNKRDEVVKTMASDVGNFESAQVYVLINEHTASASEVIAGALQDHDIGTIIGRRSYGKGLVQREMELGDGSAVRLTVARYYTPTGRSIQKPYGDNNENYHLEYLNRYENGELKHKDSIQVNDSLRYTTPNGKVVYGGGGITPDVFIPKDTHVTKEKLTYMLRGGIMDRFVFNKLEKDRSAFTDLSKEEFIQSYELDEEWVREFISYLHQFNFDYRFGRYQELLKLYLKASMGEQLFNTQVKEQIINSQDPYIKRVERLAF